MYVKRTDSKIGYFHYREEDFLIWLSALIYVERVILLTRNCAMLGQIFQRITEKARNRETMRCLVCRIFTWPSSRKPVAWRAFYFFNAKIKLQKDELPGRRQAYLIYNLMHIFAVSFLASHIRVRTPPPGFDPSFFCGAGHVVRWIFCYPFDLLCCTQIRPSDFVQN